MDNHHGGHGIMRTIIQLDTITNNRIITDTPNDAPIPAYAFAISETLLPNFTAYLSDVLQTTVTRELLPTALNTFMLALGINMTFVEGTSMDVSSPDTTFTRILLSVGANEAVLSTLTGTKHTVIVSRAATCLFSVDDWNQFVVGAFGGGSEAVAIQAIEQALNLSITDER